MAPFEIRNATLKQLRQTLLFLTSPAWDIALLDKTEEEKRESKKLILELQAARLKLQNAVLSEIRDKLLENEKALTEGREKINQTLTNLQNTKAVMTAVKDFLAVLNTVLGFLL